VDAASARDGVGQNTSELGRLALSHKHVKLNPHQE